MLVSGQDWQAAFSRSQGIQRRRATRTSSCRRREPQYRNARDPEAYARDEPRGRSWAPPVREWLALAVIGTASPDLQSWETTGSAPLAPWNNQHMRLWGRRRATADEEPVDGWTYLDEVGEEFGEVAVAYAFAAAPVQDVLAGDFSGFPYCDVDATSLGPWTAIRLRVGPADSDYGVALADSLQAPVLGIWGVGGMWSDGTLLGLRLWRPAEPVLAWIGRPARDVPGGRTPDDVKALADWIALSGLAEGKEVTSRVKAVLEWLDRDKVEGSVFEAIRVLGLPDVDPVLASTNVVLTKGWEPPIHLVASAVGSRVRWSRGDDWCLLATGQEAKEWLGPSVQRFADESDLTYEIRLNPLELTVVISRGQFIFHTVDLTTPWVERGNVPDTSSRDDASLVGDAQELEIDFSTWQHLRRLADEDLRPNVKLERVATILDLPTDAVIATLEPERFDIHEKVSTAHPRSPWRQLMEILRDPHRLRPY